MKPNLPIVANIDVGSADLINNLTRLRSFIRQHARIVPTHVLWFLLLFFGGRSTCHATLILSACAPDRIIVAADGLELRPEQVPSSAPICKIRQGAANCFVSIAGFPSNPGINYDLWSIARRACKENGPILERTNTFAKNALPEVRRAWKHIKAVEPTVYAALKKSFDGRAHMQVVFASGPPFTVIVVSFDEGASGNMIIGDPTISVADFASRTAIREVGVSEDAAAYRRQHPEAEKLETANFLRTVLLGAIELEGEPKRIGPLIAILEISNNGAKWIERGACAEIKHYAQSSPPKKAQTPTRAKP